MILGFSVAVVVRPLVFALGRERLMGNWADRYVRGSVWACRAGGRRLPRGRSGTLRSVHSVGVRWGATPMADASMWAMIHGQRRDVADMLEGLTPEQWQAQSLAGDWRVRDV